MGVRVSERDEVRDRLTKRGSRVAAGAARDACRIVAFAVRRDRTTAGKLRPKMTR